MRVWSGLFFIPEMLAFQKVPPDSGATPELSARVASWTFWTWFREPLDIAAFSCFLSALFWLNRPDPEPQATARPGNATRFEISLGETSSSGTETLDKAGSAGRKRMEENHAF
jgi:hypothetical protein